MTVDSLARSLHISSSMLNDFTGAYKSCIRGIGLEYQDIRAYVPGDDFRAMAWTKSAQSDSLQVKTFQEDRSRTIVIAHDISLSMQHAYHTQRHIIPAISNLLITAAALSEDYIALATWSDRVNHFIPPQQGIVHAQRMMKYIQLQQGKPSSCLQATLQDLSAIVKHKRSVIIIISDFITMPPKPQTIVDLACEHDVIFIHIEEQIPIPHGWFFACDPESHEPAWTHHTACYERREQARSLVRHIPHPARTVSIPETSNYYLVLKQFFRQPRR